MDTVLLNFLLYCPKCKRETLVNVQELNISVIKEPDAKAQSQTVKSLSDAEPIICE
jgi:uncharacterized protein YbaR (Trm112 family)